jgi:hypothetical protein
LRIATPKHKSMPPKGNGNRRAAAQFLVRFSGLRIMLSHGTWSVFARHSPHGFLLRGELARRLHESALGTACRDWCGVSGVEEDEGQRWPRLKVDYIRGASFLAHGVVETPSGRNPAKVAAFVFPLEEGIVSDRSTGLGLWVFSGMELPAHSRTCWMGFGLGVCGGSAALGWQ